MEAGVKVCIVTGRRSNALIHRCKNLGIGHVFDGAGDKAAVLDRLLSQTGISVEDTAFIGDDLPDRPLMKLVGCSIAVADAHHIVRETADMVTSATGGIGAVREVCEAILQAQGHWERVLERFS